MHSKNFALATNEFQKSHKSQKCDILKTAFGQNFKCLVFFFKSTRPVYYHQNFNLI